MNQQKNMQYEHADRVKQLTLELVNQPSVSGTHGECEMVSVIVTILQRMNYFKKNPQHIKKVPIHGDPLKREAVVALMEGDPQSKHATLLLSHFDVVGVDDFGQYKPYAFLPDQLESELKKEKQGYLDAHAREDLLSGDYLFGRGTMDMKAGLAMQLSMLQDFSESTSEKQNLLLVAVPDEEKLSKGMFAAVEELDRMKQDGWSFDACICSEPNFSSFPNDYQKYVYTGSTGKLLPFIYCLGRETHVGQPLEGINASVMAAQIAVEMEWSEVFADEALGEKSPSPTCLRIRDLKDSYDVQTPNEAYLLYNVLTLSTPPVGVIDKVVEACKRASESIYKRLVSLRSTQTNAPTGLISEAPEPKVYTLSDLYRLGVEKYGDSFQQTYKEAVETISTGREDYSEQTLAIARKLSGYFLDLAPFYLVLLQPPYYPHVSLDHKKDLDLLTIVDDLKKYADECCGEQVAIKTFFPGLSDVSYCRNSGDKAAIQTLQDHMPLFGNGYDVPLKQMANIDIPTINIGPFGKDAHKRTERLQLSYSTETAPLLLKKALLSIKQKGSQL
ncbi:M20/M25/M40 family metallo-hydrolase [Alkalicoccobacillus murimartini]|uniref:Arginine utilization protein RocB n=1 Tax=Alkalicoccobacillus murimartini TaxID=171685 RepID=A0ABT9YHH0_9BACI|nr:M20/M25/M40 family metallo-hydrolase [Alkalicoccobacillus murimartini]MDQ0207144.1 arginine utilization protein RocB [Alkalicoccobacillus murimartini]